MKEFIKLQTKEVQDFYAMFLDMKAKDATAEAIIERFSVELRARYDFGDKAEAVATRLCDKFSGEFFADRFVDPSKESAVITKCDYDRFWEYTAADEEITPQMRALLMSFIIAYRHNYHPSGWIKYDKKNIFYLADLANLSSARQTAMTNYLHAKYGLNMRVVGSNQPTPCFGFDWLNDQPPVGSEANDLINLGPLSPSTVQIAISETGEVIA